ncbi:MAG TPA: GAF domain-containing protein [Bryobacteraceae bacterium]|nr:GAF domain-containing protein [Bryobacteraceae bacterium]
MSENLSSWLENFLSEQKGTSGTVHLYENGGLRLAAAVNIPPPVQQVVAWVPNGKGMAGLALQRNEPVQTCNLQEDRSGNVKPGAKAVNAQAAIAIPVPDQQGGVRAVVGIAFQEEREFTSAEIAQFTAAASSLPV